MIDMVASSPLKTADPQGTHRKCRSNHPRRLDLISTSGGAERVVDLAYELKE